MRKKTKGKSENPRRDAHSLGACSSRSAFSVRSKSTSESDVVFLRHEVKPFKHAKAMSLHHTTDVARACSFSQRGD